jgi:hypothetical protein
MQCASVLAMRGSLRSCLLLLAAYAAAACTDEVQLARETVGHTTSPPGEDDDEAPAESPELTRADYCAGRGSPVASELLAPEAGACREPAPRVFRYAVCTCQDAVFSGGVDSDAFDSALAPYAPRQGGGNVGTNAQLIATGPVELLGALTVAGIGPLPISVAPFQVAGTLRSNGDLTITAAGTHIGRDLWVQGEILAVAADASVGGDVYQPPGRAGAAGLSVGGRQHALAFELPPPCACDGPDLLDVAAIVAQGRARNDNRALAVASDALYLTASAGPLALDCGRFAFDGGTILDDARIVARGRSALFIDGDLAITGSFAPDLGERGEMDVFVDGALVLSAGAVLGSIARPGALRIYVGGPGDLLLSGSITLAAGVYAPHVTLYHTAEQDLYGALFLAGYYATAHQHIHYDAALLHPAQSTDPGSCGELTPPGGCRNDADCEAPFICQAQTCSARLQ